MTTAPVRLGIIGAGRISQAAHLPAIEKSGKVELTAVADASPGILGGVARRYHVANAFTDPQELLAAGGIDAVIVAVPDRFHHSLVLQALRSGHHVLVEKPLASTTAEAEEMVAVAAEEKKVLQTGSMKRHDPGVVYAHDVLSQSAPPVTFTAWYRVPASRGATQAVLFPPMYTDTTVSATEARIKADRTRHLLATHGAHTFDSIRFLAGEIESLFVRHTSAGPDHAWQGTIRLRAGGLGTFELLANVHGEWQEGYDIHTPTGTVEVRTHTPFVRRASDVRIFTEDRADWVSPALGSADSYFEQVNAFADAVNGEREVSPAPEDGVAAVRLIEAAAQSVATGQEVIL